MAESKSKRPAEFPTDWHWTRHLEDLERELAGRLNRKAELEALGGAVQPSVLAEVESEIAAVRAKLDHYGVKHEAAAKRPAAKAKTTR